MSPILPIFLFSKVSNLAYGPYSCPSKSDLSKKSFVMIVRVFHFLFLGFCHILMAFSGVPIFHLSYSLVTCDKVQGVNGQIEIHSKHLQLVVCLFCSVYCKLKGSYHEFDQRIHVNLDLLMVCFHF